MGFICIAGIIACSDFLFPLLQQYTSELVPQRLSGPQRRLLRETVYSHQISFLLACSVLLYSVDLVTFGHCSSPAVAQGLEGCHGDNGLCRWHRDGVERGRYPCTANATLKLTILACFVMMHASCLHVLCTMRYLQDAPRLLLARKFA